MEKPSLLIEADRKKVVVISDAHLTKKAHPPKLAILTEIISQADLVIINGDFWDGYQIHYSDFLTSAWSQLFPLLKEKKAIYLYGNHDKQQYGDGTAFSTQQADQLLLKQAGVEFHLEHGHQIAPTIDVRIWLPRFILGLGNKSEGWLMALRGRQYLEVYRKENELMKAWKVRKLPSDQWLICGHTHLAELSEADKFANSGLINWGMAQYLVIENGAITCAEQAYSLD